jgi:hypothetical protein
MAGNRELIADVDEIGRARAELGSGGFELDGEDLDAQLAALDEKEAEAFELSPVHNEKTTLLSAHASPRSPISDYRPGASPSVLASQAERKEVLRVQALLQI